MSAVPTMTISSVSITQASNFESQIDHLTDILDKYQGYDDSLSKSLFRWGARVLQIAVKHHFTSPEEMAKISSERIHELATEILVNPLDGRSLQYPILERDWTWERGVHQDCRQLFKAISPLDGEAMNEAPAAHLFALEMIAWARVFTPAEEVSSTQLSLFVEGSGIVAMVRCFVYQRLAKAAIVQKQQRELRDSMEFALISVDERMVHMRKLDLQIMEEAEEKAADHEVALDRRIGSITQIHRDHLGALSGQISFMEESHRKSVAELEDRIAKVDQANIAVADALKAQLTTMHQAHKNAVAALDAQIQAANVAHQQAVGRLETQLSTTAAAHCAAVSTISSMTHTHHEAVTKLEERVTASTAHAIQVQSTLSQAEVRNAQHAREIQQLRNDYARARSDIQRLHEELDDADSCVIM